jgi:pyruvate dehydrogenase phosphatase
MTVNEAVQLTAAHMEDPIRDDTSKASLAERYKLVDLPETVEPYQGEPLPGTMATQYQGSWSFHDENAALHLLRNSLGHGDEWARHRLLSLCGDAARQYRDDRTVM